MQFERAGGLFVLGLVVAAAGCGGSTTSPQPSVAFSLSAQPATIAGALCTGCGAGSTDRESKTTILITETGGASGTVTSIAMVLRDSASAVITQGEFETGGVASLAGTSRIAANGTLSVPCGVHYPVAQQGKAATLTYTVRLTDDRGNSVSHDIVVTVTST